MARPKAPWTIPKHRHGKATGHITESVTPFHLRIVLEPSEEGGFTVFVPTLPGCISEGESKEEALRKIREAIELYLESVEEDLALSPNAELIELAV